MKKSLTKLGKAAKAHRIASFFIIIIILGAGYAISKKVFAKPVVPQYTLSPARMGSIMQTITGSGQVSAENQLDVTSEVSGKILSIQAKVGDHVKAGDLLATLDARDALVSLENARIAYAKLTKPADTGDLTNAENNLSKAYTDGYSAISNVFLHFPSIMSGLKDLLYSRTGYLSDGQATAMSETGRNYRFTAATSYENTNTAYTALLEAYRGINKNSSQAQIENMLVSTTALEKQLVETLKLVQIAHTFISTSQPDYLPSSATATGSSITSWSSTAASDLSSVISSSNSIASNKDSVGTLQEGADALDVRSQQLSLEQAEKTYQKYFIRAPFEGIVGRIPVSVYGQASGSTVIATIVGDQKKAVISLNEVDAAKVLAGQKVKLTFDAIDGFTATGTVQEVDQIGTVTQGVVSYGVKILITTVDPRIKPGMSVNTSIITQQKENVLVVPSAAIKTFGNRKFVQALDMRSASSSPRGSVTISSSETPRQIFVTTGESDDTNTEILTGLTAGQTVITRTVAGAGGTATAPSILNAVGGNRPAGGQVRRIGG